MNARTPWKLSPYNARIIVDKEDFLIMTGDKEISAFIVKACNNHEALVDALTALILLLTPSNLEAVQKAQQLLTDLEKPK